MIEVRPVQPDDWRQLRAIWLEALRTAPDAFCTKYEDMECVGDDLWRGRSLQDGEGDTLSVLALDDAMAIGMAAGLLRGPETTVEVVSVFVSESARGTGTADAILSLIETWATGRGASSAYLLVEEGNSLARHFYEKRCYFDTKERVSSPSGVDLWQARYQKTLPGV